MKKTLLLSAVTLVILGISSISYGECRDSGDWVCFNPLPDLTYDKEPDASCMEMICRQGCVENIKTGEGACCPVPTEGTNCLDDEYNDKGCLIKKKKVCTWGECQSDGTCGCPEGVDSYTKTDGTTGCCPPEAPKWDDTQQKCGGGDCTFKNKTYHHGDAVPNANGCGQCNNGTIEAKEADCKECNTTNWTWKNVSNYTGMDEDGKCCVSGKRQYHASQCPAPCYDGETRYAPGDKIGQCGVCGKTVNGTFTRDTSVKFDDCHECTAKTSWQIVEKESAKNRICGQKCCPVGHTCENGECMVEMPVTAVCVHNEGNPYPTEWESYVCSIWFDFPDNLDGRYKLISGNATASTSVRYSVCYKKDSVSISEGAIFNFANGNLSSISSFKNRKDQGFCGSLNEGIGVVTELGVKNGRTRISVGSGSRIEGTFTHSANSSKVMKLQKM